MVNKIKLSVKSFCKKVKNSCHVKEAEIKAKICEVINGTDAEAYVDTGVKILIAVVIGALLLTLLYTLFNTNIMPAVTEKIQALFNYAG